jgi:hypothetical protein
MYLGLVLTLQLVTIQIDGIADTGYDRGQCTGGMSKLFADDFFVLVAFGEAGLTILDVFRIPAAKVAELHVYAVGVAKARRGAEPKR